MKNSGCPPGKHAWSIQGQGGKWRIPRKSTIRVIGVTSRDWNWAVLYELALDPEDGGISSSESPVTIRHSTRYNIQDASIFKPQILPSLYSFTATPRCSVRTFRRGPSNPGVAYNLYQVDENFGQCVTFCGQN